MQNVHHQCCKSGNDEKKIKTTEKKQKKNKILFCKKWKKNKQKNYIECGNMC